MSEDEEIIQIVERFGWYAASINDHQPPFIYTIGLMKTFDHPDFVIFGVEADDAHALLNGLINDIKSGKKYSQADVYSICLGGDNHRIGIRKVHETQIPLYFGYGMGFMRNIGRIGELRAVQIFWPDREGKFPFEANCDLDVYQLQPRLDISLTPSEIKAWKRQWE